MSLFDGMRVVAWLVRDTFRQSLESRVFWFMLGLSAVAGPVRNAHGDVVASMSVSGPTFRLTGARMRDAASAVCGAAASVASDEPLAQPLKVRIPLPANARKTPERR